MNSKLLIDFLLVYFGTLKPQSLAACSPSYCESKGRLLPIKSKANNLKDFCYFCTISANFKLPEAVLRGYGVSPISLTLDSFFQIQQKANISPRTAKFVGNYL
jgi:hypothetical protein